MTHTWQTALLLAYSSLVLLAVIRHVIVHFALRRTVFLKPDPLAAALPERPLVSILVPARDEADTIGACLRSLLAQDYGNFEIIVIDDRSTDATARIVAALAEQDDRLRLVQILELPPGWTGKTHALHIGQQHARGEWLLFVDADTSHHPMCLSTVMRDALRNRADMESLLPKLEARSFWERVIQPFAGTCLMILFPLPKVNNRAERRYGFANGQFILVRRPVYDVIGGHAAVRDKFVEDIHLGRLIRRHGFNLRVVVGRDIACVRMYASLEQIVRGWSRIFYSAVNCKPKKLYLLAAFIVLLSVTPYFVIGSSALALLGGDSSSFVVSALALGLIHEALQLSLYARTYHAAGSRMVTALTFRWLAVFSMLYILGKTVRLCHTHQVSWRGTTYGAELTTAGTALPAHKRQPAVPV